MLGWEQLQILGSCSYPGNLTERGTVMCEYCNEPYENMSIDDGYIRIKKTKYSPSGYSLCADTSYGEYAQADSPVYYCPMCGREL